MSDIAKSELDIVPPFTVISGGQTGADLAGLLAAERCCIPTTGWAPRGFKTEKGPQPLLAHRFSLKEHPKSNYDARTIDNARAACVTLILSPKSRSSGTIVTMNACNAAQRPYLLLSTFDDSAAEIAKLWLVENKAIVLNIAGNRESVCPGLTKMARDFLVPIFTYYKLHLNHPMENL